MQKALTALCTTLLWGTLTLVYGEVVDLKTFGQCGVVTEIDDFTDRKTPKLACFGEGDNFGDYGAVLLCHQQRFGTVLEAGIRFHGEDTIDVLYRFDKGKLGEGSWGYNKGLAISLDKAIHDHFLQGIEKAKKLFFKVGDEDGVVDLTGSAGAVTEYKKRCSALSK